jgi:hypothetical protein
MNLEPAASPAALADLEAQEKQLHEEWQQVHQHMTTLLAECNKNLQKRKALEHAVATQGPEEVEKPAHCELLTMNFWNPITDTSLWPNCNLQDYLVQNKVQCSHQQQNMSLSSWVCGKGGACVVLHQCCGVCKLKKCNFRSRLGHIFVPSYPTTMNAQEHN